MKQFVLTIAAVALTVVNASAQSLEEGKKMLRYERYASAKKALQPLAATDAMANYYYGLAELGLGNTDAAMNAFVKYPEDYANISGTVRVKFVVEGAASGMQAANSLVAMSKKKDWVPKRYAADAITYSKGGDKQVAVNLYAEVLEKMSTPELLISAGDAYLEVPGGGGQAMTNFEKAVEKDPNNSLAFSRMGKLMYQAKNYEAALEYWDKAQKTDPTNPLPYFDMANAYVRVGKYSRAKEMMDKYMQYSDRSEDDEARYVEALFLANEFPAAIQKISELKAKGIDRDNFYGILGLSYLEDKDSLSGVKALENLLLFLSKSTQANKKLPSEMFLKLGRAYLRNNMGDSANISFSKALQMDTTENKIATYRDIAEAFRLSRDWVNGAAWYEKIISDFPDKATANDYYWGGIAYYYSASNSKNVDATAQVNKSLVLFNKMIEKYPEHQIGYYSRAKSYAALDPEGEKGLGIEDFEKWLSMLAIDQETAKKSEKLVPIAYQYLTAAYYHKGDKVNAIKYADLVLTIDPKNEFAKQVKDYMKAN